MIRCVTLPEGDVAVVDLDLKTEWQQRQWQGYAGDAPVAAYSPVPEMADVKALIAAKCPAAVFESVLAQAAEIHFEDGVTVLPTVTGTLAKLTARVCVKLSGC